MSTNHDAVAALPITGSADKSLLRNVLTKRMPYVLADADDVTNLVAVDPSTGAAIIDIVFLGRVFHYDATDTTTANDGVSCLVSFEGRRYKLSSASDVFAFAVLDNTHSAPPASPAIGDSYLIAAAATGAWVGKSNFVTVFTRRGWEFINFAIGRLIYIEAIDTYYHKNAAGSWIAGLGAQTLGAATVPITSVLGANASFVIKVENQTTNTPPVSPVAPTAYVIGPAPTGAWAGNSGKLAICLVSGSFAIVAAVAGDVVYDKALAKSFQFGGSAWVSAAGSIVGQARTFSLSDAGIGVGSTPYTFSQSVPPTTALAFRTFSNTISYAAKAAGALLRLTVDCSAGLLASGNFNTVGILVDSGANAIDWQQVNYGAGASFFLSMHFYLSAPDALAHTYKFASWNSPPTTQGVTSVNRFNFMLEEFA